jgi:hypothetical protein
MKRRRISRRLVESPWITRIPASRHQVRVFD